MKLTTVSILVILIISAAISIVPSGCGQRESEQTAEQPAQPTEQPQQPEAEKPETEEPAAFLNADVAAGKAIYNDKCASCHGSTGKPVEAFADQSPDFSSEDYQDTPPQQIFDVTKNGKSAMPAYKDQLTDEQIWDVTAYVKSL